MTNGKQRERLVELLDEFVAKSNNTTTLALADHLLANGVIVPPCKVGQTVYLIRKDTQTIYTCSVTAIIQRNTFQYLEIFIEEDKRKTIILAVLGESLFLTKEEAEEALKGGVQG